MAKKDDKRMHREIDYQGNIAQNHLNNMRNDMVVPQAQNAQNLYTNASSKAFEDYDRLMGDYGNWSKTGGYSGGDLANIRARALSPLRAVYANANREVDRSRALQGGYSPGYGVLKARMAREMGQGMSDATTNAEAQIAEMVNQGKRFGMQGQSGMYGATPGMASHFGGMSNQAMNNWMQTQGLQQQLGLGRAGLYQGARGEGFDYSWIPKIGGSVSKSFD